MKNKKFFSNRSEVYRERAFRIALSCCEKNSGQELILHTGRCAGELCALHMEEYLYMFLPFVTNCYQQNINPRILLDIVGHRSWKMTDHYTHPEKEFMHHEFEKYEDLIGKQQ